MSCNAKRRRQRDRATQRLFPQILSIENTSVAIHKVLLAL